MRASENSDHVVPGGTWLGVNRPAPSGGHPCRKERHTQQVCSQPHPNLPVLAGGTSAMSATAGPAPPQTSNTKRRESCERNAPSAGHAVRHKPARLGRPARTPLPGGRSTARLSPETSKATLLRKAVWSAMPGRKQP